MVARQAITIYGSPRSRSMRTLWVAAELGLEFTHVPVEFDDLLLKEPEFLRVNPAGTVPAIVDDGFALSESLAINLYLAKKYGSAGTEPLYPSTIEGEAEVWRWTLWAQGHLEPWIQRDRHIVELLSPLAGRTAAVVNKAMIFLDATLAGRAWLAAPHFTAADLNVAAVLSPSRAAGIDFSLKPNALGWLKRCYARPAAVSVRTKLRK